MPNRKGALVDTLAENIARCPAGFAHHWIIEAPNGPTVEGVCKRCGETRVYPTTTTDLGFDVQLDGTRFGGRG